MIYLLSYAILIIWQSEDSDFKRFMLEKRSHVENLKWDLVIYKRFELIHLSSLGFKLEEW